MGTFTIFPAIDLHQGKVVRLSQGDLGRQTVYSESPAETARRWLEAGAHWLHVVNLDGAFEQPDQANYRALQDILRMAGEFSPIRSVQFGGGLRDMHAVEQALSLGVQRVVLGTAIVQAPQLVAETVHKFGAERVAAGLDALDGTVMLRGWTESGGLSALEALQRLAQVGLRTFIFTDIACDGVSGGINLDTTITLSQHSRLEVIASGGVRGLEDICQVYRAGLAGVIVGRALYEGLFSLEDALRITEHVG